MGTHGQDKKCGFLLGEVAEGSLASPDTAWDLCG